MDFGFGTRLQPQPIPFDENRPRWKQVHGVAVAEVVSTDQECGEVDAVWTRFPNRVIAVVTADCVPLLLTRNDGRAVAAIHAGWRGTQARIVENFFNSLPTEWSKPSDWRVRIGPAIHACCYQVSEELIEQFVSTFSELPRAVIEPKARMLDLIAIHRAGLVKLGLTVDEIHPDCTHCSQNENMEFKYFSYRRGDRNSRQYSMIKI